MYCADCQKKGHMKHSCPDNILAPLKPLPPMTADHRKMLNKTLASIKCKPGLS